MFYFHALAGNHDSSLDFLQCDFNSACTHKLKSVSWYTSVVEVILFLLLIAALVTVILAVTVFVLAARGLAAVMYEFNPPIYIGVEKKVRMT